VGARGPQPKDPQKRQRERTGDALKAEVVALPRRDEVPAAPAGLSKSWIEQWETFWSSDMSRTVSPEAMPSLVRLFKYRDQRDRLEEICEKEPFLTGSKGQPVVNPLFARVEKLESQIVSLEDRFGLNPRQRMALGASMVDTAKSLSDLNRKYQRNDRPARPDPRLAALPESDAGS
jgi:hypothetical protein